MRLLQSARVVGVTALLAPMTAFAEPGRPNEGTRPLSLEAAVLTAVFDICPAQIGNEDPPEPDARRTDDAVEFAWGGIVALRTQADAGSASLAMIGDSCLVSVSGRDAEKAEAAVIAAAVKHGLRKFDPPAEIEPRGVRSAYTGQLRKISAAVIIAGEAGKPTIQVMSLD